MTTLDNSDVPGTVVQAAHTAYDLTRGNWPAIIRAALQAWLDCGMARIGAGSIDDINDEGDWIAEAPPYSVPKPEFSVLILRLDAVTKEPEHD